MNCLDEIFAVLRDEPIPQTPEYLKNRKMQNSALEKMQALVGPDLIDEYMSVYWDHMEQECRRFFRWGIRLGLELLRLERPPV